MNGGVIVLVCIVGALVLCEVILPRISEALFRWQNKARTNKRQQVETQPPSAGVRLEKTHEAATPLPASEGRNGAILTMPEQIAEARSGASFEDRAVHVGQNDKSGMRALDTLGNAIAFGSDAAEAQRLWDEAQDMPHQIDPDWEEDHEYLEKIYAAARLGYLEAMVTLGDYAYRRGAVVEAFYWTILAEMKGASGLDELLCEMRTQWLAEGCPGEFENVYEEFGEEQGEFARTLLCLQCDVDPQYASTRLEELADAGNEAARLFVQRVRAET